MFPVFPPILTLIYNAVTLVQRFIGGRLCWFGVECFVARGT